MGSGPRCSARSHARKQKKFGSYHAPTKALTLAEPSPLPPHCTLVLRPVTARHALDLAFTATVTARADCGQLAARTAQHAARSEAGASAKTRRFFAAPSAFYLPVPPRVVSSSFYVLLVMLKLGLASRVLHVLLL